RNGHEVDLARDGDPAHQIGEEKDRPLEHAYEQRVEPGVVAGELLTQLLHPRADVVGLDQRLGDQGIVLEAGLLDVHPGGGYLVPGGTKASVARSRTASMSRPSESRSTPLRRSAIASSLAVSARGSRSGRPAARSAASRRTSTRSARGMSSRSASAMCSSTCSPVSSRRSSSSSPSSSADRARLRSA